MMTNLGALEQFTCRRKRHWLVAATKLQPKNINRGNESAKFAVASDSAEADNEAARKLAISRHKFIPGAAHFHFGAYPIKFRLSSGDAVGARDLSRFTPTLVSASVTSTRTPHGSSTLGDTNCHRPPELPAEGVFPRSINRGTSMPRVTGASSQILRLCGGGACPRVRHSVGAASGPMQASRMEK